VKAVKGIKKIQHGMNKSVDFNFLIKFKNIVLQRESLSGLQVFMYQVWQYKTYYGCINGGAFGILRTWKVQFS